MYSTLKKRLSSEQKLYLLKLLHRAVQRIPYGSLPLLAFKHGTDKLNHGYIPHYVRAFAKLRWKRLNIVEIGVGGYAEPNEGGESLRMWADYFPRSMIYGVDIHDKRLLETKRIKTFQGSQNDTGFLESVAREIGRIDIVIDDGSHISEHVITSFNTLFPLLVDNGIYVIEDLHTSYFGRYGGAWQDLNAPNTSMALLKSLLDGLNYGAIYQRTPSYLDQHIVGLEVYPQIAFIFKGFNTRVLAAGFVAKNATRNGLLQSISPL